MGIRRRLLLSSVAIALLSLSACMASAAELQLAGIRLGRSALTIIQKYGNPTEVRIGASSRVQGAQAAPAPAAPTDLNAMMGMMSSDPNQQFNQAPEKKGPPEVTWVYRFPKNKTLEFIVSPDGRVMQIAAYGVEWPGLKTSKGISMGSTYKDLIVKYGFPESHDKMGIELIAKYPEKQRAVFALVGQTVVGITIGLMD